MVRSLQIAKRVMSAKKPIRILLIDEHTIVRAGYRLLIEAQPEMHVIGEAAGPAEALDIAGSEAPDVIVLDLDFGVNGAMTGMDLIQTLVAACPGARVLALHGCSTPELAEGVARRGAMGLVSKNDSVQTLIKAIEKVNSGEAWFDRSTLGSLLSRTSVKPEEEAEDARVATLTARERGVVTLIAEGLKNKQIAERLFIGETTVTHHLSSIFRKLGVSDRLELVIYAFGQHLARMPLSRNKPDSD